MRAPVSFWMWLFLYLSGLCTGVVCVFVLAATGSVLKDKFPERPVVTQDADAWKSKYIGATVDIGGAKWTVTGAFCHLAHVSSAAGKEMYVSWALVVNQVDKACAAVEKP